MTKENNPRKLSKEELMAEARDNKRKSEIVRKAKQVLADLSRFMESLPATRQKQNG